MHTIQSDPRRRLHIMAMIALALLVIPGPVRAASESARDYLAPVMTRPQYAIFCGTLGLASEQRDIADLMFADYTDAVAALIEQTDDEAEAAGRSRVEDALHGRARIRPEELRELRSAVLETYLAARPRLDARLAELLENFGQLPTEVQRPRYVAALRDLRRRLWLHPRQQERLDQAYAGDGVDLLQLVAEASRRGGELGDLEAPALAGGLADYAVLLDAVLIDTAADWRDGRLRQRLARIRRDDVALGREQQRAMEHWAELYHLNQGTARQIGEIITASLGEEARRRWQDRIDRALFPWLVGERTLPDRQVEWIRRNAEDDAMRRQAEQVHRDFAHRQRELRGEAIGVMVKSRLEQHAPLYPMMDPAEARTAERRAGYERLLRNSGAQTSLESDTAARLESLLDPATRHRMRGALRGAG